MSLAHLPPALSAPPRPRDERDLERLKEEARRHGRLFNLHLEAWETMHRSGAPSVSVLLDAPPPRDVAGKASDTPSIAPRWTEVRYTRNELEQRLRDSEAAASAAESALGEALRDDLAWQTTMLAYRAQVEIWATEVRSSDAWTLMNLRRAAKGLPPR